MATPRVQRGRKTEDLAAEYYRLHGWEGAESVAASLSGKDITGRPGWSDEVKATKGNVLPAALRQATKNAEPGETPVVIWRPQGYGPERIDEWVVAFRFKDAVELMRKAEGWSVVDNEVRDTFRSPAPASLIAELDDLWMAEMRKRIEVLEDFQHRVVHGLDLTSREVAS
jgi:hypothetical protein